MAECRCWRPLRFSHVLTARETSTSERAVASSTEMGQLFQPLAVLSHHLHCYNNGLRTRKAPSHNDGRVTPHYTISLTATAEEHPNTVMSAPLRHPSVAGTEHIDTLSAGGPRHRRSPAMELSRHVDVGVHTGPQPTLPSTHSKPTSSCNPIAPVTGGGGGGGGGGVQRRHLCNASLQSQSEHRFPAPSSKLRKVRY